MWLSRFEEAFPDCKLYFQFQDMEALETSLVNGHIDGFLFSDAQTLTRPFTCQRLFAIEQSFICSQALRDQYHTLDEIIAQRPFLTKSNSREYIAKMRRNCGRVYHQPFGNRGSATACPSNSSLISLSQLRHPAHARRRCLSRPERHPPGRRFTEHAVLAYRQDGMTEELKKFLSLFAGMP